MRFRAGLLVLALGTSAPAQDPRTLAAHDGWVGGVAFFPDGKLLATASADHNARLWDVGAATTTELLKGHTDIVAAVAVSPDGRHVATAGYDKTARLWDPETGEARHILRGTAGRSWRSRSATTRRPLPRPGSTATSACGTRAWAAR